MLLGAALRCVNTPVPLPPDWDGSEVSVSPGLMALFHQIML